MANIRHIALMTVCIAVVLARGLQSQRHQKTPVSPDAAVAVFPPTSQLNRPPTSQPHPGSVRAPTPEEADLLTMVEGRDLDGTLPAPAFAALVLHKLDDRAKSLVERKDHDGLVELKLSLVRGLEKADQISFLLADSNMSYMQFALAKNAKSENSRDFLEQSLASADAMIRVDRSHPFAYLRKAFAHWRVDQNAEQALAAAQEGLRQRSQSTEYAQPTYDHYFWQLTQMVAMAHSKRGDATSARAAVSSFMQEMRNRPGDQQGLLKEAQVVDSHLQKGRVFSRFVLNGKVTE